MSRPRDQGNKPSPVCDIAGCLESFRGLRPFAISGPSPDSKTTQSRHTRSTSLKPPCPSGPGGSRIAPRSQTYAGLVRTTVTLQGTMPVRRHGPGANLDAAGQRSGRRCRCMGTYGPGRTGHCLTIKQRTQHFRHSALNKTGTYRESQVMDDDVTPVETQHGPGATNMTRDARKTP